MVELFMTTRESSAKVCTHNNCTASEKKRKTWEKQTLSSAWVIFFLINCTLAVKYNSFNGHFTTLNFNRGQNIKSRAKYQIKSEMKNVSNWKRSVEFRTVIIHCASVHSRLNRAYHKDNEAYYSSDNTPKIVKHLWWTLKRSTLWELRTKWNRTSVGCEEEIIPCGIIKIVLHFLSVYSWRKRRKHLRTFLILR